MVFVKVKTLRFKKIQYFKCLFRFVREPVRSRERDTRSQKEILKEREMEEEEKEVKRAARKAEEKESIYQVRSNNSTKTSDCSIFFIFP